MGKWYGSLNNRCDENHQYVEEIKVGDGVTEYLWSDRNPFEVTKVINQKHIFIRPMHYERTDSNGMSDCQDYKYSSDLTAKEKELKFRYNHWWEIYTDYFGKKKYRKINISIGVMERYYDFSF